MSEPAPVEGGARLLRCGRVLGFGVHWGFGAQGFRGLCFRGLGVCVWGFMGLGFRVWGLVLRVWGSGLWRSGLACRVSGLGSSFRRCEFKGLGVRV